MRRARLRLRSPRRSQVRSASAINRAGRLVIYHEWLTFSNHRICGLPTSHKVSKCNCISQHINQKVIVLSKCLLLVQFCLAHVISPDCHKACAAVVLCYVTDTANFLTCVCWPLWSWAYQGQIILPLSIRSVLWQISCPTSAFPWATTPLKTLWLCPETIPFGARKKGKKLLIVRYKYIYLSNRRIATLSSEADSVTKLMMNTMKMTWTVKTYA